MIMPFCEGGNIYLKEGAALYDLIYTKEVEMLELYMATNIIRKKVIKGVAFKVDYTCRVFLLVTLHHKCIYVY